MDSSLNWIQHINRLRLKLILYNNSLLKLMTELGRGGEVKSKILNTWYLTIIECLITYGAGIWLEGR